MGNIAHRRSQGQDDVDRSHELLDVGQYGELQSHPKKVSWNGLIFCLSPLIG